MNDIWRYIKLLQMTLFSTYFIPLCSTLCNHLDLDQSKYIGWVWFIYYNTSIGIECNNQVFVTLNDKIAYNHIVLNHLFKDKL